jgi:uncharacterized protein YndB with AHSA1/START domain
MPTKSVSIEPVVKTVTVSCTPEEAFRYFTADFGRWWPAATHSVVAYASQFEDKPSTVILEPRVSGRIFERTRAGEEHAWGNVLVWQPPTRVAFSFHPGRDEQRAQTVEVTFAAAPGGTTVVLTHSGWDKLGADALQGRDSYNQGWEVVFVTAYPQYVRTYTSGL